MQLKPTVLAYGRRDGRAPRRPHPAAAGFTAGRGAAPLRRERTATGRPSARRRPAGSRRLMSAAPSVGIVGGGILGATLALRLAQAGAG